MPRLSQVPATARREKPRKMLPSMRFERHSEGASTLAQEGAPALRGGWGARSALDLSIGHIPPQHWRGFLVHNQLTFCHCVEGAVSRTSQLVHSPLRHPTKAKPRSTCDAYGVSGVLQK